MTSLKLIFVLFDILNEEHLLRFRSKIKIRLWESQKAIFVIYNLKPH